jgi:hypothetical protein
MGRRGCFLGCWRPVAACWRRRPGRGSAGARLSSRSDRRAPQFAVRPARASVRGQTGARLSSRSDPSALGPWAPELGSRVVARYRLCDAVLRWWRVTLSDVMSSGASCLRGPPDGPRRRVGRRAAASICRSAAPTGLGLHDPPGRRALGIWRGASRDLARLAPAPSKTLLRFAPESCPVSSDLCNPKCYNVSVATSLGGPACGPQIRPARASTRGQTGARLSSRSDRRAPQFAVSSRDGLCGQRVQLILTGLVRLALRVAPARLLRGVAR